MGREGAKALAPTCHCGWQFENSGRSDRPRKSGWHQKHRSPRRVQIATSCRHYAIAPANYWRMDARGCSICGHHSGLGERRLAIDHNHTTGSVRGRLCLVWNRYPIGANTIETARAVVVYLANAA